MQTMIGVQAEKCGNGQHGGHFPDPLDTAVQESPMPSYGSIIRSLGLLKRAVPPA